MPVSLLKNVRAMGLDSLLAIEDGIAEMEELRQHLDRVGKLVEQQRIQGRVEVASRQALSNAVKDAAGLYWIETNMPVEDLLDAIRVESGKNKSIRMTAPEGVGFTQPTDGFQIVYSGTGHAIRTRLFEHIFNKGNKMTAKLSAVIDKRPFSNHQWYVSSVYVPDYPSRYALESWWRLSVGWPPFCIR